MNLRARCAIPVCLTILLFASTAKVAAAVPTGHVTGIGGIFFKAQDPKALAKWYRDTLGLPLQTWGGAMLRYDAPDHPPKLTWQAFPASTTYFAPSSSTFMINFAVDDMEALLARLATRGVVPLRRSDDDPNGKFA